MLGFSLTSRDVSFMKVQTQSGTSLSLFLLRLRDVSADAVIFIGNEVKMLFERSTLVKAADHTGMSGR